MKIIVARKISFKQDGLTSASFIGVDENTKEKVVIENCHLIDPPFGLNMRTPCLFGNLISRRDIYYYRIAYFCPMNNHLWKIIVK